MSKTPFLQKHLRPFSILAAALACAVLSRSLYAQDVNSQRIVVTAEPVATPNPRDDTRPKLDPAPRRTGYAGLSVEF
jgi:hypothetical protein